MWAREAPGIRIVGWRWRDFDLEFRYPPGWTLVATGKPTPVSPEGDAAKTNGQQVSHWVSERPIPVAGFNLGKYKEATVQAGDVTVETYATKGVERDFPDCPNSSDSNRTLRIQPIEDRQLIVPEQSFASTERGDGGRERGQGHPVFCRPFWAFSLQSPGSDADAGAR